MGTEITELLQDPFASVPKHWQFPERSDLTGVLPDGVQYNKPNGYLRIGGDGQRYEIREYSFSSTGEPISVRSVHEDFFSLVQNTRDPQFGTVRYTHILSRDDDTNDVFSIYGDAIDEPSARSLFAAQYTRYNNEGLLNGVTITPPRGLYSSPPTELETIHLQAVRDEKQKLRDVAVTSSTFTTNDVSKEKSPRIRTLALSSNNENLTLEIHFLYRGTIVVLLKSSLTQKSLALSLKRTVSLPALYDSIKKPTSFSVRPLFPWARLHGMTEIRASSVEPENPTIPMEDTVSKQPSVAGVNPPNSGDEQDSKEDVVVRVEPKD